MVNINELFNIVFWGIISAASPYFLAKYILSFEQAQDFIKSHYKSHLISVPTWLKWLIKEEEVSLSLFSPNGISFSRTFSAIASAVLYYYFRNNFFIYTLLFSFGSDAADGEVARKCKLSTEFGKWFDPLCDKLSYLPPIYYLAKLGYMPLDYTYYMMLAETSGQTFIRSLVQIVKKWRPEWDLSIEATNIGKVKAVLCFSVMPYIFLITKLTAFPNFAPQLLKICFWFSFASAISKLVPKFLYADILSSLNLALGIWGCKKILQGKFILNIIYIMLGGFCDLLDGASARKHGGTRYGHVLDDFGDGSSFALNPFVMILRREIKWTLDNPLLIVCNFRNWIIFSLASIYFSAIIFRLVRFVRNKKTVKLPKGVFQGLPSPGAAAIVLGAANIFSGTALHFIIFVVSLLAISHWPFIHGRIFIEKIGKPCKIVLAAFVCTITAYNLNHQGSLILPWLLFTLGGIYIFISTFVYYKYYITGN